MGFSAKDIKKAQATASEKVAKDHTERDEYFTQKKRERLAEAGSTYGRHDKGALTRAQIAKK